MRDYGTVWTYSWKKSSKQVAYHTEEYTVQFQIWLIDDSKKDLGHLYPFYNLWYELYTRLNLRKWACFTFLITIPQDCCNDDGTVTNFYADDKSDEIDAVRTHGFGRLEPARWVRVRVSTDLRWIGHDEKCFRFELLGCRPGRIHQMHLLQNSKN